MSEGYTLMTVLRVGTMIAFIAVFMGIALRLLRPSDREETEAQARLVLHDDTPEPRA